MHHVLKIKILQVENKVCKFVRILNFYAFATRQCRMWTKALSFSLSRSSLGTKPRHLLNCRNLSISYSWTLQL